MKELDPSTRGGTSEELLEQCKAINHIDLSAMKGTPADAQNSLSCIVYANGVIDGMHLMQMVRKEDEHKQIYCIPSGVSGAQIAKIIVKFGDDHPEQLHNHAVALVFSALHQAFPCE